MHRTLAVFVVCIAAALTCVAALAAPGDQLWVDRYGAANRAERATALAAAPDGSKVFATGTIGSGDGTDLLTVANDATTGSRLWARRYNPGDGFDAGSALAVSPDSATLYVAGMSTVGPRAFTMLAQDAATGARLWVNRYAVGAAYDVAVSPDGSRVFATGTRYTDSGDDYAVVAYDAATGARVWAARYGLAGAEDGNGIAVSPDGSRVYVTGTSVGADGTEDFATVAYDAATGARLWLKRYGGTGGQDRGIDIAAAPDGTAVYVSGDSAGATTGADYLTMALDATTGAKLWSRRLDGTGGGDYPYRLALSADGTRLVVTGESAGTGTGADILTVAYAAATGARAWDRRYDGPAGGDDFGESVAVSADSTRVYVTGDSTGAGTFDAATLAYDAATGADAWPSAARYDAGDDVPLDVAVAPDGGRVFVGGFSDDASNSSDLVTLAYAAS